MDGTRKYAWWSGLPQGSPDFFMRPIAARGLADSASAKRRAALPISIDRVDQHPQSAQVLAVEPKSKPRQTQELNVIGLGWKRGRLLNGAGLHDICKLVTQAFQEGLS